MFGPNTYFSDDVKIAYSHRDKRFFDLFEQVRSLFVKKFSLQEYDVLFVPGTGTVGIEALMYSTKNPIKLIGHDGVFTRRWECMSKQYPKNVSGPADEMYCLFETSCSGYFTKDNCFVDAISAFPYYDIPEGTKAFITCLNKQLGSYVGMSVVCVRKDLWPNMLDTSIMSYLNLSRYKEYHDENQTPSTAPTFIFEHLYQVLNDYDLDAIRKKINTVSDLVVDAVGVDNIIGEHRAPAITVKPNVIPDEFARKHDLYGYWTHKPNLQVFTYSEPIENYEIIMQELKSYLGR